MRDCDAHVEANQAQSSKTKIFDVKVSLKCLKKYTLSVNITIRDMFFTTSRYEGIWVKVPSQRRQLPSRWKLLIVHSITRGRNKGNSIGQEQAETLGDVMSAYSVAWLCFWG